MKPNEPRPTLEEKLEQSVEIGTLCAFYGGLLTPKQLQALRWHYEEDLSLGEIAGQLNVSRQNVHELIVRSVDKLRSYETAIGAVRRMEDVLSDLHKAQQALHKASGCPLPRQAQEALQTAQTLIDGAIEKQEEENVHGI